MAHNPIISLSFFYANGRHQSNIRLKLQMDNLRKHNLSEVIPSPLEGMPSAHIGFDRGECPGKH
jgi:hypothetical protein